MIRRCANAIAALNDVVLVAQESEARSVLESGCDHTWYDSLMEVELPDESAAKESIKKSAAHAAILQYTCSAAADSEKK